MILSICDTPKVMEVMNIVNIIITIIRIVVPIVLLFSLMFKLVNASTKNDEDAIASIKKKSVPSIIAAALIFIVPVLVNLIVSVSFPNSEYTKCIANISNNTIQEVYEDKAEKLVSKTEETLNINDYIAAMNYMPNVKDNSKRESYEARLEKVKKLIDELKQNVLVNDYDKVNYSNFKWVTYKQKSGPVSSYYDNIVPYAIWAPENVDDLNGVSLPLIVWLHGRGELGENGGTIDSVVSNGVPKVLSNWSKYNLKPIPAIVVAPHHILDSTRGWGQTRNLETIKALIKYCSYTYNIDSSKIVLMGHSYGGNGVFWVSNSMKEYFHAVVALSSSLTKTNDFDKSYFSNLKIRGYSELHENKAVFEWMGCTECFFPLNADHSDTPRIVMTEDKDNNGVSDLVEWMFYE